MIWILIDKFDSNTLQQGLEPMSRRGRSETFFSNWLNISSFRHREPIVLSALGPVAQEKAHSMLMRSQLVILSIEPDPEYNCDRCYPSLFQGLNLCNRLVQWATGKTIFTFRNGLNSPTTQVE